MSYADIKHTFIGNVSVSISKPGRVDDCPLRVPYVWMIARCASLGANKYIINYVGIRCQTLLGMIGFPGALLAMVVIAQHPDVCQSMQLLRSPTSGPPSLSFTLQNHRMMLDDDWMTWMG